MTPIRRYAALGSSMAAGPGITPRVPGSPRPAGRSERNYPHLVAEALGAELTDVTFSGATTENLLSRKQFGAPPQLEVLDESADLVTITIGGNDVGYVPMMIAALTPGLLHRLPGVGAGLTGLLDPARRELALAAAGPALRAVGTAARDAAPNARIVFVDYLTLLPPAGQPARPLSERNAELARHVAARLAEITASAATDTGCELVSAAAASVDHHAWSPDPWTAGPGLSVPLLLGRAPLTFHPNAAGMRAVADLVLDHLGADR
ncbi:hydrolase [Mycolicibacterium insubricum]|nr:hydrolase [Mycolicibacterium insubricum]